MPAKDPNWWYAKDRQGRIEAALKPLADLYGHVGIRRFSRTQAYRSRLPVICIGNLTVGGTGKTPLAIMVAELLKDAGEEPVFLTRGHGGRLKGPVFVDMKTHTARDVGDEPLLLTQTAPTLVCRNRRQGAIVIENDPRQPSVIVMDDGLQNPALRKDLTIAVIDGQRGIGNGLVIPAGPLRAPLDFQLGLTDAVLINQSDNKDPWMSDMFKGMRRSFPGPVLAAEPQPTVDTEWLDDKAVTAFAGIGNPDRFFALVERLGARLVERIAFGDHHLFTEADATRLLDSAAKHDSILVTTEKDAVRFEGQVGMRAKVAEQLHTLPIRLAFPEGDDARLKSLLESVLKTGGYRAGLRSD